MLHTRYFITGSDDAFRDEYIYPVLVAKSHDLRAGRGIVRMTRPKLFSRHRQTFLP